MCISVKTEKNKSSESKVSGFFPRDTIPHDTKHLRCRACHFNGSITLLGHRELDNLALLVIVDQGDFQTGTTTFSHFETIYILNQKNNFSSKQKNNFSSKQKNTGVV